MRKILTILLFCLAASAMHAQIKIGGNVYGGGNKGNTGGQATVHVKAGDLNHVYGGARMANVGGSAFVNIDGAHMSGDIVINYVYGGNDISGTVGTSSELPTELSANPYGVDNTYNAFVHTSAEKKEGDSQPYAIFIGQLYGGGNGEYTYSQTANSEGQFTVSDVKTENVLETSTTKFVKPEMKRSYLDIHGGTIAFLYGGGNNATITEKTDICINNTSTVTTSIPVGKGDTEENLLLKDGASRLRTMGIPVLEGDIMSDVYQFSRVFGGNNKADMDIMPSWHLESGKIRNLYSGGNEGRMIHNKGLLLEIGTNSTIYVDNIYGGCRKADVRPMEKNIYGDLVDVPEVKNLIGYKFPNGLAARVLVRGGDVNNVYGGNDISGKVYGGNAVGVYTSIRGNIYGGGNGSYPYTDNAALAGSLVYGDYYYDVNKILGNADGAEITGLNSVKALNAFRPNAEQVSIRVTGQLDANGGVLKKSIIGGSIYCGGNSATLKKKNGVDRPLVDLKVGSGVIADEVFLGNNGAEIIQKDVLERLAGTVDYNDVQEDFSKINLLDADQMAEYMNAVAMDMVPTVSFDDENRGDAATYDPYSSTFGSFFCGGNVGSMTYLGTNQMDFSIPIYIYNKVVGGCNNAIVDEVYADNGQQLNARYEGGIIGTAAERVVNGGYSFTDVSGNIKNRLVLKFGDGTNGGVQFLPKRWVDENDKSKGLEWNVVKASTGEKVSSETIAALSTGETNSEDLDRRFLEGHIYGGCYSSGIVNGNVVINLNSTIVDRDKLFDKVSEDELGEASLYGDDLLDQQNIKYHVTERRTGVILGQQGMDVLGASLNVFGGGKGKDTEIWGSTTINLTRGYTFQIFGGSEEGVIGRSVSAGGTYDFNGKSYKYDPKYSCTVNLCGNNAGVSKQDDHSETMAETEFIYGGGFFGPICGNTVINLGKGRVFNTFAGSCMADILGHTETYVGRQVDPTTGAVSEGFPYIRDMIYGGNDLGGRILGEGDFTSRVRSTSNGDDYNAIGLVHNRGLLTASAYIEYIQGRADAIFGGCYGTYDYKDTKYSTYFNSDGTAKSELGYTKPRMGNAFVNFRPTLSDDLRANKYNLVNRIYGAGQGYPGDGDRDIMQRSSYVLIDIPQAMDDLEGINHYKHMEVFGGGAWSGLGMDYQEGVITPALFNSFTDNDKDRYSTNIDLFRGQIGAAYGGSLSEGIVRRTEVNVPEGSTIKIGSIFGGAYGTDTYSPCDVIEANVEYHSGDALLVCDPLRTETETDEDGNEIKVQKGVEQLKGNIYGGNNEQRRTLYGRINIDVPVRQQHYKYNMTTATVYGAGYGSRTWNEYTEVNLNSGASVYEVYGGGEAGGVMSAESIVSYYNNLKPADIDANQWKAAWTLGAGYDPASMNDYAIHLYTSLNNPLVRTAEMDNRSNKTYKYNTNVIINQGAYVGNYAYGGGYGKEEDKFYGSGDVYGTTYIALLGGRVNKDIYAAGTLGAVRNAFGGDFTASANAYIAGGTLRNVYGGGWQGDVGVHDLTTNETTNDVLGETHVVIGIRPDQTDADKLAEIRKVKGPGATLSDYGYLCGVPAIQRNAYSGGEGGAVFGTANLVLNNGYIGYVHLNANEEQDSQGNIVAATTSTAERYDEKIHDETYWKEGQWQGTGRLKDCGNIFGGGYDVRSSVDFSNVTIWNGIVRNSVHGGGEIATIGRGSTKEDGATRTLNAIYKVGKTTVTMYNGHVKHNVFGGGKGYNIWGYGAQGTLYTDGYVFGQTEVQIHGGEVGTVDAVAEGHGNVFGGGDIGYVYSKGFFNPKSRVTSTGSPGHTYYYDGDNLVEDCKVVIAPWLQVRAESATINGKTKSKYDYFETDDLNTLAKTKDANGNWTGEWTKLFTGDNLNGTVNPADPVERGVLIHNAVFGGGNVSSNSDTQYANATTIYGNTTATLYDVYHRDFITIGTEHTGGLYGGGNLSLVDGYRELNITNYGTDYYGLESQITLEQYRALSGRERAYFQLQYVCSGDVVLGETPYTKDQVIKEEDYLKLVETYGEAARSAFTPYGFCSIYAGRLLNTIQRADMCGVYGSRMVLQGAKDRVADVGEKIDYTINRVGEVSLNQQRSVISSDTGSDALHGNYFGIYSLVNYMGNLTSDVKFGDNYVNGDGIEESDKTYYSYKSANPTSNSRNKGTSTNQVALASGVFLELTTENSTADHKDYGYITGVVELDLINVKQDQVGGGFVYAKNEHRVPMYYPNKRNVLLSPYNQASGTIRDEARTYKRYYYTASELPSGAEAEGGYVISRDDSHVYQEMVWETSGNFIHPSKRIVDDCYPTNNAYLIGSDNYSEAHYWYVKGEVYIYDQTVSAFTGAATAYSKEVHLPLTITAASHGKLQLLNVKPNLYAYYTVNSAGQKVKIGTKEGDKELDKVWVNNESDGYGLNEVVTWWDWHQMSPTDRSYFVTDTYVNTVTCTIDGTEYAAGTYIMDATDLAAFKKANHTITNGAGDRLTDLDDLFRSSNNIGHDSGYVLTLDMNMPGVWSNGNPTFTPLTSGVYGQRQIELGDILTQEAVENNTAGSGDQATVEPAYVAKDKVTYNYGGTNRTVNAGTAIPKTEWEAIGSPSTFAPAYICTQTVKLDESSYLLYGELKTAEEIEAMKTGKSDKEKEEISGVMRSAYICSKAGGFGGQQLNAGTSYPAVSTWCALPENDRFGTDANGHDIYKFNYNYDALDLLTSEDYLAGRSTNHGYLYENPSAAVTREAFHSPYTDQVSVEYDAVFHAPASNPAMTVAYDGGTVTDGGSLTNTQFETVRNDKRHYTRVSVASGGETIYFATENFIYNGMPYGKGQVVSSDVAGNNTSKVESKQFANTSGSIAIQYYCYEDYDGATKGTVISEAAYSQLRNDQQYFVIQGKEPTETTTLYVSSESDIKDVMSERVYTVVYQYTYYEDEDDGSIKMTNELHVINIHLELESGVPSIGTLYPPATVLPGNAVGLTRPEVQPGLYEVLTSGWELFDNEADALRHRNGEPFVNNGTPVYWYQNQKSWVAFYSKTYLGKTYSNPVRLSVANYHDLDLIMQDKEHHLYIDHPDVERASKIYLDNRTCVSDPSKSELDLLKDFFDLSLQQGMATSGPTAGHAPLDSHVKGGQNLEFFLRSNVSPKSYTDWTPIGDDIECFAGNLHGDGYTVNRLSNSLFGKLCGSVYNLGVNGTFTSAGVADAGSGYVENCWVKTTGTPASGTHPVFGNPTDAGYSQVVNCYYQEDAATPLYTPFTDGRNTATKMSARSFYNGEVAYNLNGFYLNKRYCDATNQTAGTAYTYFTADSEGKLTRHNDGHYVSKPALCSSGYNGLKYVEDRFADGDFIYAGGSVPESNDSRLYTVGEGAEAKSYYAPIWPDDYIFFGQALNYGHVDGRTHQETPSHINKTGDFIQTDVSGNRVYRAPAYYQSMQMDVAYFNPAAVFAQTKAGDPSTLAYKGMTAIDFSGYNDVKNGYKQGWDSKYFYQPLLDDGGLSGFQNIDLTKNLLAYTSTATDAASTTDNVVRTYLHDHAYVETDDNYRTVDAWDSYFDNVHGHWVQLQSDGSYTALNDHMLVDRQDFNCPISYRFDAGYRMWYQREPDNFVDRSKGWEAVSLPFTADLVTTQQKGELTHFFKGSTTGHEYWLRQFDGNVKQKTDENNAPVAGVYTADFSSPAATGDEKRVTSTFLWDYYYKAADGHDQKDLNNDIYQTYYNNARYYENYPRLASAVPYIIGFPGPTYYEFDLSGAWTAATTATPNPEKLDRQVITFASATGALVSVSDAELASKKVTADGYSFVPVFQTQELAAGGNYLLNSEGSSFLRTAAAMQTVPFRPYITYTASSGARAHAAEQIVFGNADSSFGIDDNDPSKREVAQGMEIYAKKHKIYVKSNLRAVADVRILAVSGICIAEFTIEPGETVETRVNSQGVYIVQTTDGRYTKKLAVR